MEIVYLRILHAISRKEPFERVGGELLYNEPMPKNTVIALTTDPEDYRKKLAELNLPDLEVLIPQDPHNAKEEVGRANIIIGQPPLAKQYINEAKNILWMQSSFAGIDALVEDGLRQDYILTNVKGVYGELMAEYTLAYIFTFEKEILNNIAYQREKQWKEREAHHIQGKTITILGTGSIGKEIAKKAQAVGLKTLGYQMTQDPAEFFDEVFSGNKLEECLKRADYVVSVLPKTKDTTNILNYKTLSTMKPSAILINIGRGNVVDESDLIKAIQEKKISKAVLDVFNEEPLPQGSPLWSTENIYITPHMSAYVVSDKVFEIFAENYKRFTEGKELLYKVDFSKGY